VLGQYEATKECSVGRGEHAWQIISTAVLISNTVLLIKVADSKQIKRFIFSA
jgi:hypothetical protein